MHRSSTWALTALVAPFLMISGLSSAELPERFLGVWLFENLKEPNRAEACTSEDWQRRDDTADNIGVRLTLIEKDGTTGWETGCKIASVASFEKPYRTFPEHALPIKVSMDCEGEGRSWKETANWAVRAIAGQAVMIQVDLQKPNQISVYQRCTPKSSSGVASTRSAPEVIASQRPNTSPRNGSGQLSPLTKIAGQDRPSQDLLKKELQEAVGPAWSVGAFEIEAIEDTGTRVEPQVRFRVRAKLELKDDLYKEVKQVKGIHFIQLDTRKGKEETVYAIGSARLNAGKWEMGQYNLQNTPLKNELRPRSEFSGKTILSGSSEEVAFVGSITPTKTRTKLNHISCDAMTLDRSYTTGAIVDEIKDVGIYTGGGHGYSRESKEVLFFHLKEIRKAEPEKSPGVIFVIAINGDAQETRDSDTLGQAGYQFYNSREPRCFSTVSDRDVFWRYVTEAYRDWAAKWKPAVQAQIKE